MRKLLLRYHNLSLRTKALLWIFILSICVVVIPSAVRYTTITKHEAKLYFVAPASDPGVGESFPIEFHVQTNGTAINAVGAVIKYDPEYLQVLNMTTENSFCLFYLENSFDNIKGEIDISCGAPSPGFQGDSLVVHANFRGLIPGTTSITADPAQTTVLANDGNGSQLLQQVPALTLNLKQLL